MLRLIRSSPLVRRPGRMGFLAAKAVAVVFVAFAVFTLAFWLLALQVLGLILNDGSSTDVEAVVMEGAWVSLAEACFTSVIAGGWALLGGVLACKNGTLAGTMAGFIAIFVGFHLEGDGGGSVTTFVRPVAWLARHVLHARLTPDVVDLDATRCLLVFGAWLLGPMAIALLIFRHRDVESGTGS